ncbi:LacI family DNA-binding transcriptional regulator [Sinorhizobium sp. 7-81]|uniref:LacI family DNA-binding transcriptional regulator n=1 Tax=Sinorhizobium sp. 8-89 TaxID=3049089 RepID=UPI0024C21E55|nr:LacI family DNA-binding transcriptional regulator [Sinorhizobium sp. 8-89]MDK1491770.1 LacI family DNA-binding transcriptional regulator [Sinorhizobium sp. 8-89]
MSDTRDRNQGRFVSAEAVAKLAGVSRSAVSRAFTPGASIAPATLARVHAAAAALGYQVNDLARGLLANRSRLVGLVTSDADTPFRAQMIAALSRALIERSNVPAIINIGPTAGDVANASRQLLRYRAEATVFLSGSPPASLVELTRRNGQPLILVNRAETGLDSVHCDDGDGAQQAFAALRSTGASRFAVVNRAKPSPSLAAREHAFAEYAAASGFEAKIVRTGLADYDGGKEAARLLLASGQAPDAVFCVNDLMAFGTLDHLRDAGLRVPDDVSVIGFDDVPMAAWSSYRLTTLRQDPCRIAREVVSILDRRIAEPDSPPISVYFPVELVVRKTVRARL